MKKIFVLALFMCFMAVSAHAAKYTLVYSSVTGKDNYNYKGMTAFKSYVENASNGEIEVKMYVGGQLCSSGRECLELLQEGSIDIFQTNAGEPANFWPPLNVLDLPYKLPNDPVAECVFNNHEFMSEMRHGFMKDALNNVRLMVISNSGGWRNFANTKRPIKSPADVKGLKIRTIPAELQQELVKIMGGSPTPVSWPEVYTSLGSGVAEGTKNGITDMVTMNFHDHLKFVTLDGHAYMAGLWWFNNGKFNSLPDNMKKIVVQGFDILNQYIRAYPKYNDALGLEAMKKKGVKIYVPTPEELKMFQDISKPLDAWYLDKGETHKQWLDRYMGVVGECEQMLDAQYMTDMK